MLPEPPAISFAVMRSRPVKIDQLAHFDAKFLLVLGPGLRGWCGGRHASLLMADDVQWDCAWRILKVAVPAFNGT